MTVSFYLFIFFFPMRYQLIGSVCFISIFLYSVYFLVDYDEKSNLYSVTELEEKVEALTKLNQLLKSKFNNRTAQQREQVTRMPNKTTPEIINKDHLSKIPFTNWKTNWKCYQRGDFSEICVYEYLCFDGESMYFLDPEEKMDINSIREIELIGPEIHTRFDWIYWQPYPFPPPKSKYVPHMSTWSNYDTVPRSVNPTRLIELTNSIDFFNQSVYFVPYDMNPDNIWHASMQAMNLWDAQILNETLADHEKLPPQDLVVIMRDHMWPGWEREVHRSLTQPHTQFALLPYFLSDSKSLKDIITSQEYIWSMDTFEQSTKRNFEPKPRKLSHLDINQDNLICTERAVLMSQKPRLFSGIHSATRFRNKAYETIKLHSFSPKGVSPNGAIHYSGQVIIDYRGDGYSRNIINHHQIAELVSYYDLVPVEVKSYKDQTSLETQIDQIATADVYIIVHGAGITNEIFMTPRSTLIEIMPYGMRVPMYYDIAGTLDINYIGIVSWIKGPLNDRCGGELHTSEFFTFCQNKSNLEHSLSDCVAWSQNACAVAPIRDLEQALISAYDFIGVNINTRVSKLFSDVNDIPDNDFHRKENFMWIENPWEFDVNNYPIYFANNRPFFND